MSTCVVEVCVDSLESLHNAQRGGANRIELCSALALGGLTPSVGFMQKAAAIANIPVYAMIRPRQGDFLYSKDDVEQMLSDIFAARQAGLEGIVIGTLTKDGSIDQDILKSLITEARGIGITFHRAIDHCADPFSALDTLIASGCERVLTSGCASNALDGAEMIAAMVKHCGEHLKIMAGSGVTADNVTDIILQTGVNEIHLSGKSLRASEMSQQNSKARMGGSDIDDFSIPITSPEKIEAINKKIKDMG